MTKTATDHYSTTDSWPPVKDRIDRIIELLTGNYSLGIPPSPTATPDWYPEGIDNGVAVPIEGMGLDAVVDAGCVTHFHNGLCATTKPAPRDPLDFNVVRVKRHRVLLDVAVRALSSLNEIVRAQSNPMAVVLVPFRWDTRYHGAAPLDTRGSLIVPEAKRKLAMIRDFNGDMAFALDTYLRTRGIDPDRIVVR